MARENVFRVQTKVMKSTPHLEAQAALRAGCGVPSDARPSSVPLHGAGLSLEARPASRDLQPLAGPQTLLCGDI